MLPLSVITQAFFSRPANTTQYTANDAVSNSTSAPTPLKFAKCAQVPGGAGVILSAICISSANKTTKPDFILYIFDAEPTATNDNAAWAPTDAHMLNLVAAIPFATANWHIGKTTADADGNAACITTNIHYPFRTGPSLMSLWGLVVERSTYTPVSAETFTFRLGILQD